MWVGMYEWGVFVCIHTHVYMCVCEDSASMYLESLCKSGCVCD